MKKITIVICCLLSILSCTDIDKKQSTSKKNKSSKVRAIGAINELSIIMDNELWKGAIGDTVRKYFGAEVAGLPQQEPLFSMRQMPPEAFSGFARKNRTFLKIEKGSEPQLTFLEDKYATPQLGAVFSGKTKNEITTLIRTKAQQVIEKYKAVETQEKQHRFLKSLEIIPEIEENFGVTLSIPSAYRVARIDEDFIWVRKDIPNGNMNLMMYTLPLGSIAKDSTTVASIIKMRDSIGGLKIPTDKGDFITEEAYAPYLFETVMDERFAFETKGTWEIKDRFMAGPFVNYVIEDIPNNRLVVLEGFLFAPSVNKRDNMFELEAMMKTIKFNK